MQTALSSVRPVTNAAAPASVRPETLRGRGGCYAPLKPVPWKGHPYLPSMTVMTSFIWMCSLSGSSKS